MNFKRGIIILLIYEQYNILYSRKYVPNSRQSNNVGNTI